MDQLSNQQVETADGPEHNSGDSSASDFFSGMPPSSHDLEVLFNCYTNRGLVVGKHACVTATSLEFGV